MSKELISALEKLRGSGRVTGSALTKRQRCALDEFARKTACIQETIAGRGTVYQVLNEKVLETHWRQLRPDERAELPEDLPQRALNVALSRDSKGSHHRHGLYYLLLKGAGSEVTWSNGLSTLNLSDATRDYGAATLGIRFEDDWTSQQTLWLVENQNLFDNLDWLPDGTVASVAYYGGQLSNLLIHWLAKTPRAKKVILFPDYDGVGLMNYARLRSELTEDCEFWLMRDWSRLLEKYGNPKVWLDNLDSFEAAYDRLYDGADQALLQLMETMRKQAMALEQEAIWLTIGERNHPNG